MKSFNSQLKTKTMLQNFFKKAKRLIEPVKDADVLIAEIHNEFDTATEKLLNEAKEILKHPEDKGARLQSMGFYSSQNAKDFRIQQQKRIQLNLVNHFIQKYPNNKYISVDDVEKICKKYGLVLGHTKYFIGDVPEKNLMEIEAFKFNPDNDCSKDLCDCNYYMDFFISKFYKICAPIIQFKKGEYELDGNGYELKLNDPIVLFPVREGFLIISKWGLEASDELVVNEKMN